MYQLVTRECFPKKTVLYISRSEQAPVSGFHPRDESTTINCGCLKPRWCDKTVDPERKIPDVSYLNW